MNLFTTTQVNFHYSYFFIGPSGVASNRTLKEVCDMTMSNVYFIQFLTKCHF